MTTELKVTEDAQRKFELWFFRDINEESRLSLLKLFDLPVDEIGKVHSHQRIGLKRVLRQLASTTHQADDATVGTADQAIKFAISGKCEDADTFLRAWKRGDLKEWPEFIAAMREDR